LASIPRLLDLEQIVVETRAFEADPAHYRENRARMVAGDLLRNAVGTLGGARPKVNARAQDGSLFRQVRGLSNKDGAEIVATRADRPFESVDDLWRRADVPVSSLVQLAETDAMKESPGPTRREVLWALKALREEPLELFSAAAQREGRTIEEVREPAMSLRPMTSGREVIEDLPPRRADATPASCELPEGGACKPPHRDLRRCHERPRRQMAHCGRPCLCVRSRDPQRAS
jgi:hypothetical protein